MTKIKCDQIALDHLKRKYSKTIEDSYRAKQDLENEIWKPMVFDYEGKLEISKKYIVSNYGRIKIVNTNKILKPTKNKDGYLLINMAEDGYRKTKGFVHRKVAFTFIDNPDNLPQISHKRTGDEFRDFNHVDNLEWTTMSEDILCLNKSTNRELFSIGDLYKIREYIQNDDWSFKSIITSLGFLR